MCPGYRRNYRMSMILTLVLTAISGSEVWAYTVADRVPDPCFIKDPHSLPNPEIPKAFSDEQLDTQSQRARCKILGEHDPCIERSVGSRSDGKDL